ncbi:MAG: hypothetical protein DMD81_24970 [Candidatus Rokuibacteriota bacterium]|nr:MAG: hypothetical protein DMD81_24970 [Candidatus Rokubacteria bacterium]
MIPTRTEYDRVPRDYRGEDSSRSFDGPRGPERQSWRGRRDAWRDSPRGGRRDERGFLDRASDEDAQRRRMGDEREGGRGG